MNDLTKKAMFLYHEFDHPLFTLIGFGFSSTSPGIEYDKFNQKCEWFNNRKNIFTFKMNPIPHVIFHSSEHIKDLEKFYNENKKSPRTRKSLILKAEIENWDNVKLVLELLKYE